MFRKVYLQNILAILLVAFAASIAAAQEDVRRVRFARGATSAEVRGTVSANNNITYVIGARSGQRLTVTLTRGVAFRIYAPDGNTLEGGKAVNYTEQDLEETGDYAVTVEIPGKARSKAFVLRVTID